MKKIKSRSFLILSLLFIGLLAAVIRSKKKKPKGLEVQTTEVQLRNILERVGASGRIFPEREVKISSDVSGEIVQLYVAEGDSVKQGQLLAKVNPDIYLSNVQRGKAARNNAKSMAASSKAQIESTKAQIEQITASVHNAKTIYKRNKQLFEQGVISRADFENTQTNLAQLKANLKSAQAQLKAAEQSAQAAQYAVKSAEATLRELQTNLKRTTILAPTTGIISALKVQKGERVVGTIQMAGTEMMRIADFSAMEARVEVSENDIIAIQMGDSAHIEVDAYSNRVFKGVVTEIGKSAANVNAQSPLTADQLTKFIVKIRIDPQSYADLQNATNPIPLRPGMSASADIYTHRADKVIAVPIPAVSTRNLNADKENAEEALGEVVFVVRTDTAYMVPVSIGIQDDEYIEIKSGLTEGQVVVKGPYAAVSRKLKDKTKVRIKTPNQKKQ